METITQLEALNNGLSYLGDKSKFILNGRERTINY